jgi:hypothetical protein
MAVGGCLLAQYGSEPGLRPLRKTAVAAPAIAILVVRFFPWSVDRKEVTMKVFILALGAALGFSSTASADCLDVATNAIQQKGFTVKDKGELEDLVLPQNSGGLSGHRAWLRVARCERGYVVVNMHPSCDITGIWTTEGCDVPGMDQALRD